MILLASIFVWSAVVAATIPATWRLFSGNGSQHDAVKFSYTLFALMVLGFNFKWLLMPESMVTVDLLRAGGIAVALFLLMIIRAYRAD